MAKFDFKLPEQMKGMAIDPRGYPIPYSLKDGQGGYNFRVSHVERMIHCVENKLCGVCGKKLHKDYSFFLGGNLTLQNCYNVDPSMHRVCAEFSLDTCPHIKFESAERRTHGLDESLLMDKNLQDPNKPKEWFLIKSDKFRLAKRDNDTLIEFRYVAHEKYVYKDGLLVKADDNLISVTPRYKR